MELAEVMGQDQRKDGFVVKTSVCDSVDLGFVPGSAMDFLCDHGEVILSP